MTVDGNESVTAVFLEGANTLSVTTVGNGQVTISPAMSTYPNGALVSLTATFDAGWQFAGWSGDASGTDNPLTITMNANQTITATFTQTIFTLTVNSPHGPVTKAPDQTQFNYGETVVLTMGAIQPGWTFDGWSGGGCSGTDPCTVTMTEDTTVTANFTKIACSTAGLIWEIEQANLDPDATTITLDPDCTVQLTAAYAADPDGYGPVGLPPITTPVTLVGSGTTIARNTTAAFRLFYVTTTGSLTIENTTLSNGLAQGGNGGHGQYDGGGGAGGMGGAIFNMGSVSLTDVTLVGNKAIGGDGGNDNTVALTADAGGGGMGGNGANAPGGNLGGSGGGVNGGLGGISGSNAGKPGGAGGGGGGAANAGGHGVGGAGGFGGGGGGGSTGGAGGFGGGGGGGQDGTKGGHGGIGGGDGSSWVGGGGGGLGGAIFNEYGTLSLTNCTFSDNLAQGGSGTVGSGGNNPTGTGSGGSGIGGAVFSHEGIINVSNPTFSNNSVMQGGGGLEGFAVEPNIYQYSPTTYTLTTSIPTGGGTITRSKAAGPYYNLEVIRLTATPANYYTFTTWGGDLSSPLNPTALLMNGNKTITASFEYGGFTLTVNPTPAAGGTVVKTPDQPTYTYPDTAVILQAIPNPGYTFVSWTGDQTGSTNPVTIQMTKSKTISANFTNMYALTVTVVGPGSTVTKSPSAATYVYGTEVTLTPNKAVGYTFTGWTGANASELVDIGGGKWKILMNGAKAITANFTNQYTLTVISPHGTVTQTPDQPTYTYGTLVALSMGTVDTGYTFTGWSGGGCTGTDPCNVTMNSNTEVTANFQGDPVNLTIETAAGGAITADLAGPYHYGDIVTLTATADPGYAFTGWTGDLSGITDNPAQLTLDGDKTIGATFELQNLVTLTINQAAGGTITAASEGPYHNGDTVTLTATADSGYSFTGWTGDASGTTSPVTITLDGDKTVSATFTQDTYTLTIVSDHAPVTKSPDQETYTYGQEVTLTMGTVADGWTFTGWSSNVVDNKVTITADTTVTADFTQNTYTLTVVSDHGSVTAAPVGPYAYNQTVTLTMGTVENGYTFTGWSGGGCTGTDPCTLTITADTTVTAAFTQNAYTLTIVSDHAPVTKSPDQETYTYGQEVTLTMSTVADGWTFTGWSSNVVDNKVTITADTTVTAAFTQNAYTLTIVSDHAPVTKSPDQETYTYGQEVTLTMGTVADGWTFTGWSSNVVDNKVTITADTTVTAAFTQNTYTLTVVSDHGSVTAAPVGPYAYNQTVTLTMGTVENGYTFTGWSGGGCTGTDPCTLTITADTTVTAAFTQNAYTLTIVSDHAPVTKSPDQETYTYGQEVTLTMGTVADGWTFTGWSSNVVDNKVTITADTTVTAAFTQNTYTLTVVSDHAPVTKSPDQETYTYGQEVTLTMGTVADGWTFTGWSSNVVDNKVTITADTTVTAAFTQDTYTLTVVSDHAPVTKSPDQETYTYGQEVTLTMGTVADGWTFTGWSSNVVDNKVTITADTTVTAAFTQNTYTLTVVSDHGSVTAAPVGPYAYNQTVTLTMGTVENGYTFTGWSGGGCTGTDPCTLTITADTTVTAAFTQNAYTLTIVSDHAPVTKSPDQETYTYGQEVTLTMGTVADGWTFTGWSSNVVDNKVTITADTTVTAAFTQNAYTLTVVSDHGSVGHQEPAIQETYAYGQERSP